MTLRPAPRPTPEGGGEPVTVDRATLEAAARLIAEGHEHDEKVRAAAYEQGRQAYLSSGYDAGYALGHDTGLSARQHTRGYVHGILDGFAAGCAERHQLTGQLLRRTPAAPATPRPDREAEAS
jgi:hypothetical protein